MPARSGCLSGVTRMDKFSGYVVWAYIVTFVVLIGYLGWLWLRLRQEQRALEEETPRP